MKVATGDNVKVHYRGTLPDGTEFDNSHTPRGEPLEFTIGSGQMIVGFNDAIIGMTEGEKKNFSLTPRIGVWPQSRRSSASSSAHRIRR